MDMKKLTEQLDYLQSNHFDEWLKTRSMVQEEMSAKNNMWCVCRRLATGLHESSCKKFANAVTKETVKRLSSLLPTN